MTFDDRLEKVMELAKVLPRYKPDLMDLAAKNLKFAVRDTAYEVGITVDRLQLFEHTEFFLSQRQPLGGPGSRVAVMLSYNGSAWLNTVIASVYLAGNKVLAKFASRGNELMGLTESFYRPLFGDDIQFYRGDGRSFMHNAIIAPHISCVIVFGFDANVLPYEADFRRTGKKFVFEGPGVDPFIVFPDADLELALGDLMNGKFSYSGQTCTAPKRIFVHRAIYDEFIKELVQRVRQLRVGDPYDPETQVSPVGSNLAVNRIKAQLRDAVAKKARIILGGEIQGNLVYPTIIRDATDEMAGMQEEVFGPVVFASCFDTSAEVIARARNNRYGLRAAVFGGLEAKAVARTLVGEKYCHPVPDFTFGRFGTVALNAPRLQTWRGSLVTKAVGGYGYSGWIWETVDGRFRLTQGPKLLSIETSRPC
ncbi:aldehyde dehydrogenase family protein [Desulfobacca acetoxidans]|uniref:Aldehyde Dehydrogenase n=1 Tax=Desulfobacca acetoxidans (strain ATCC 700848 / DSM 11109 / ASRB2) TaxID=880072 RepID=F2NDP4_DESAR|nr:aldehyde dehydrogenase family protein [Desulfobacca acetoxidans]AEB10320.1 Aldehyde Dehydrogenase [Desulfobacca acetoxidans DSM 11109]